MLVPDVADSACKHDRLVVAADLKPVVAVDLLLIGSEVSCEVRTPELIVESGCTERSVDHDVQRAGDSVRLAEVGFPGLLESGDAEVRYGEAADAGLGL